MRISSRAVIFKEDSVILIYREREGEKYYVFPGGGLEEGETLEENVVREIKEELGLTVDVKKQLYVVKGQDFEQNFFLCEWVSGEIGTGDAEEYDPNRPTGLQKPMLIKVDDIEKLNVVSPFIVKQFLADISEYGYELDNKVKDIIEN